MVTLRRPLWYRHAWWLPAACSLVACVLVGATFRPSSEDNGWLGIAILAALPWSLLLLALDLGPGFAARASVIVSAGLCANAALLWWATAVLRSRLLRRDEASEPAPRDASS
jgi:hypothetical protein